MALRKSPARHPGSGFGPYVPPKPHRPKNPKSPKRTKPAVRMTWCLRMRCQISLFPRMTTRTSTSRRNRDRGPQNLCQISGPLELLDNRQTLPRRLPGRKKKHHRFLVRCYLRPRKILVVSPTTLSQTHLAAWTYQRPSRPRNGSKHPQTHLPRNLPARRP